jgi:hypothetical protein
MTHNIEINCAEYVLKSGSIGHSQAGSVFRCTISPVSDDMADRLDAVARSNGIVRLLFPDEPLLLERVTVERVEAMSVRIVGRIVVISLYHGDSFVPRNPDTKGLRS